MQDDFSKQRDQIEKMDRLGRITSEMVRDENDVIRKLDERINKWQETIDSAIKELQEQINPRAGDHKKLKISYNFDELEKKGKSRSQSDLVRSHGLKNT